jgi:hypothetical protein
MSSEPSSNESRSGSKRARRGARANARKPGHVRPQRLATALALTIFSALASVVWANDLAAQDDVEELAARCASAAAAPGGPQVVPALLPACREAVLVLQAAQGGIGLLAASGAQLPGSASTLGRRFGGIPRFSASLRGGLALLDIPDVSSSGTAPYPNRSFVGLATQASLTAGLLDGFSLVPTIGGVLSLDVFATLGMITLPDEGGFQDGSSQWGVGANVGLIRESFTTPGLSVSVALRNLGETQVGNVGAGDAAQVSVDPSVLSVRGIAGKDLLAFGFMAGVGWDRYKSDGVIVMSPIAPATSPWQTTADGFTSERLLFFGGLSLSMLVLQGSLEGGWARGFDAVAGRPAGGYDPEDSSLFLSIAARLTL